MSILSLAEDDVRNWADVPSAIEWLERCFRCFGDGGVRVAPRERVMFDGGAFHVMAGSLPCEGLVGSKLYTTIFDPAGERRSSYLVAFSTETGERVAAIESYWLSLVRTAATTAVAVKYLGRAQAGTLAIIGTGATALLQVEASLRVRPFGLVRVYSRTPSRRAKVAAEVEDRFGVSARPADSAAEAVDGAEVIITATNARQPILEADWLPPRCLIVAMGSNYPDKRELATEIVARAEAIFVESTTAARTEAGDLVMANAEGALDWGSVRELGSVVAGGQPIEPTAGWFVFKSVGVLPEDLAMVASLRARSFQSAAREAIP